LFILRVLAHCNTEKGECKGFPSIFPAKQLFLHGGAERSSVALSVESHLMALAAEESRVTGQVVSLEEFRKKALQNV
jgi:hypothetical protein